MQDLRLVGIHEDGQHLLLADAEGTRYRIEVDDALRSAIRRERALSEAAAEGQSLEPMRPREVQALIRAGVGISEVADRANWDLEKVRRYEPPIRAERDYVAGLARAVPVRGRSTDSAMPTLGARVAERLVQRGVESERVSWDAWKGEDGEWSVVVLFPAGGRERRATWSFSPADRALSPSDDEARWLGEDEQQPGGPIPAAPVAASGRTSRVYDVEAEGGLAGRRRGSATPPPAPAPQEETDGDGTVDLMTAMRARSARRQQRPNRRTPTPTDAPIAVEDMPEQARPIEPLHEPDPHLEPPLGSHARADELLEEPGFQASPDNSEDETAELDTGSLEHREVATSDLSPDADRPGLDQAGQRTSPSAQAPADEGARVAGTDPITGTGDLFEDLQEVADGHTDAAVESPEADDADTSASTPPTSRRSRRRRAHRRGTAPQTTPDTSEAQDPQPGSELDGTDGTDETTAAARTVHEDTDPAGHAGPESEPAEPERATRRVRPSVPSWDDIMFGSRASRET